MGVHLVRWMEVFRFIIQHVYSRWMDYKVLPRVMGHWSHALLQYKLLTLNTEKGGATRLHVYTRRAKEGFNTRKGVKVELYLV